MFDFMCPWKIN